MMYKIVWMFLIGKLEKNVGYWLCVNCVGGMQEGSRILGTKVPGPGS